MAVKKKWETDWYDDLCKMYQKTKIPELRNVLWEQVKLLVYGRVRRFINEKKPFLKREPELCQKLYQESFFVFQKAVDIWDQNKKTKFLTFLGDILDQEILNIIRLDFYYRGRDAKIAARLTSEQNEFPPVQEQFEKQEMLEEVRLLMESYHFENNLEREVTWTMVYGQSGDWTRLQKKSRMSIVAFAKFRKKLVEKLKVYILSQFDEKQKAVLMEVLKEK